MPPLTGFIVRTGCSVRIALAKHSFLWHGVKFLRCWYALQVRYGHVWKCTGAGATLSQVALQTPAMQSNLPLCPTVPCVFGWFQH